MTNTIPIGAVQIQMGLYLIETPYTVSGVVRTRRELYSADGYCFWNRLQPENYVDGNTEGELLPLEERTFARYARLSSYYTVPELINIDFISVPIQNSYENVSAVN